ncbi:GGDEF domain-containing response regulator [Clostridium simiarum]|nr:diguanylate cyclase [Clostridium simiarum]
MYLSNLLKENRILVLITILSLINMCIFLLYKRQRKRLSIIIKEMKSSLSIIKLMSGELRDNTIEVKNFEKLNIIYSNSENLINIISNLKYTSKFKNNKIKDNIEHRSLSIPVFKHHFYEKTINPLGEFKILIADHNIYNIDLILAELLDQNYSITIVNNGLEVINEVVLYKNNYDLILMDSILPKISGFKVCKEIRKKYSMSDVPIIMMMDDFNSEEINLGFEVGFNDYIIRPFLREELLAKIKTFIILKDAVNQAMLNAQDLELEKYYRRIAEKLRAVTELLNSTLDMKELMVRLLGSLKDVVPYDSACVMLFKDEDLYVTASCNFESCDIVDKDKKVDRSNPLIERVISTCQPVILTDTTLLSSNYRKIEGCNCCNSPGSWIGIPLIAHKNILGILILEHKQRDIYQEAERDIVLSFASQASIAIENAKLFGEIKYLAITDGLTGLNNRRYFFELSNKEFEKARIKDTKLSTIMIDVDHFKIINDSFGHVIGDKVLKEISSICNNKLRDQDIIGRYGGEEISITLIDKGLKEAVDFAEDLRSTIEKTTIIIGKNNINVTISLGIQEIKFYHEDFKSLLEEADKALYLAKKSGRNRIEVYE